MFTPNTRLCFLLISQSEVSTRQLIFIDMNVNIHTQLLLSAITSPQSVSSSIRRYNSFSCLLTSFSLTKEKRRPDIYSPSSYANISAKHITTAAYIYMHLHIQNNSKTSNNYISIPIFSVPIILQINSMAFPSISD